MAFMRSPALSLAALLTSLAAPALAQVPSAVLDAAPQSPPHQDSRSLNTAAPLDQIPRYVLSTNPIALQLAMPNVEYEVRTVRWLTVGAGTSRSLWASGYTKNREAIARLYPAGTAFNGLVVGLRLGASDVVDRGTYRTWAFEGGYSSTPRRAAYFSLTGGMRRLINAPPGLFGAVQAILRMNVGVGF
jgi:hypothetical protein